MKVQSIVEMENNPRGTAVERHRCNAPAQTPSEYLKRNLYLPFIYLLQLITELTDRLVLHEHRFIAQYLKPLMMRDLLNFT